MSQFANGVEQMPAGETPKTSGLAIASLVCSLICCVPITTIPAIFLGLIALKSISANPMRTGKGLAITGIILGIVFTAAQLFIGYRFYQAYTTLRDAPYSALAPGFSGDYTGMRANFGPAGNAVSDTEAKAFVDEATNRYGKLTASQMDFQAFQTMQQPTPGQTVLTMPWMLVFENKSIAAELTFDAENQDTDDKVVFSSLRIIDPDAGDLVFPPPSGDGG